VALEDDYLPWAVDCWSLGIVMLEVTGGRGSAMQAAGRHGDVDDDMAAELMRDYFAEEGRHAIALSIMGGVRSQSVTAKLQMLLKPVAEERASAQQILELYDAEF